MLEKVYFFREEQRKAEIGKNNRRQIHVYSVQLLFFNAYLIQHTTYKPIKKTSLTILVKHTVYNYILNIHYCI